jgi:endonuclease/exonuclease/phosphatase family metal-dependent hydrolase
VPELTVVSFNVHWGRGDRHSGFAPFDLVEVCHGFEADVMVLQETWAPDGLPAQHDEVAAALGMEVIAVTLARSALEPTVRLVSRGDPERTKGTGDWCLAMLSRKPIRTNRVVALPQLPVDPSSRVLLEAEIDVDGTNLTVVGTHFSHLEYGSPLQTRALRRGLPPVDRAAAFVGDMNMWGWTIAAMTPPDWRRAVLGKTWPARRPRHQIDHILVTPTVEVVSGEVLDSAGSDHRPIRARLRVT